MTSFYLLAILLKLSLLLFFYKLLLIKIGSNFFLTLII